MSAHRIALLVVLAALLPRPAAAYDALCGTTLTADDPDAS